MRAGRTTPGAGGWGNAAQRDLLWRKRDYIINSKEVELLEQARKDRKKFVRYPEGAEIYSMGIQSFMKIAKEAHAVYKIRNIALVNTEVLDAYLEAFRE